MNEKCKYCDYVSKCSRKCEYDSILCKVQRSFPKVVDKSYEQLQQENEQLKEDIKNIIKILNKNCDDLEATEEEFESLDRWQELERESGSNE